MKRNQALNKLKACIPSFGRGYMRWGEEIDKETDKSWLYLDETYTQYKGNGKFFLPEVIEPNFLIGVKTEIDGVTFESRNRDITNGLPRTICLEVTDFAYFGNRHKYGQLKTSSPDWVNLSNSYMTRTNDLHEIDPRIGTIWKTNLRRILSPEDLGEKGCDWEGFSPHEATERFSDLDELYCTAAYVTILRFTGNYTLHVGSYAAMPDEDDFLVKCIDGNITFCEKLKKAIREMTEND